MGCSHVVPQDVAAVLPALLIILPFYRPNSLKVFFRASAKIL